MAQPWSYTNLEFYPGTKKPIPGGLQLLRVNTTYYKDNLARILEITRADPGAWHYNSELTEDWARQMCVEYKDEKGVWQCPSGQDNHGWDCSVLELVGHDLIGIQHWPRQELEVAADTPENTIVAKSKCITV